MVLWDGQTANHTTPHHTTANQPMARFSHLKMTKAQVVAECRRAFKEDPDSFQGDAIAQRELFNNYADTLCKLGVISSRQYETWVNPF
jgi:hypothetical protein